MLIDKHLADGMGTFQNGFKITVGKRVMGETSLIVNWAFFFFHVCLKISPVQSLKIDSIIKTLPAGQVAKSI